jgi:hypothetical protein
MLDLFKAFEQDHEVFADWYDLHYDNIKQNRSLTTGWTESDHARAELFPIFLRQPSNRFRKSTPNSIAASKWNMGKNHPRQDDKFTPAKERAIMSPRMITMTRGKNDFVHLNIRGRITAESVAG